jgi:Ser/Thr protein kinase RdoA (MazF antagonist)
VRPDTVVSVTTEPVDGRLAAHSRELEHDLSVLASGYGWGQVTGYSYLAHGLMNPNWRVDTQTGSFAVKRIVDVPLDKARRNLATPGALAAAGLPTCAPLTAAGGGNVVEASFNRGYCVFPWVEGVHVEGWRLAPNQVRRLGELVGRMHQALARAAAVLGWPPVPPETRTRVSAPSTATAEADRFLGVIDTLDAPRSFDLSAARTLEERKALLEQHAAARPAHERPSGPLGWTHGDLQYRNLLWRRDRVAAVLDWDRVAVRPLAEEVVRTAQVQFATKDGRLDLERVAAFTAGYRGVVDLADEALRDAAVRLWWKRMTDFWPLQWHYDKADHGCDDLWTSGEALLAWWSGHRDLVQDAFTGRAPS